MNIVDSKDFCEIMKNICISPHIGKTKNNIFKTVNKKGKDSVECYLSTQKSFNERLGEINQESTVCKIENNVNRLSICNEPSFDESFFELGYFVHDFYEQNFSKFVNLYLRKNSNIKMSIENMNKEFLTNKTFLITMNDFSKDIINSKFSYEQLREIPELDYSFETFDSMQEIEFSTMVFTGPNFKSVNIISNNLRKKVVLWLLNIPKSMKIPLEVQQMAVGLFDQYILRKNEFNEDDVYKLGWVVLNLALKLEKISNFSFVNIVGYSGYSYTTEGLAKLEYDIFNLLDMQIAIPVPLTYLRYILLVKKPINTGILYETAKFITDLCLVKHAVAGYPYSLMACAVYVISHSINDDLTALDIDLWTNDMECFTGFSKIEIKYMAKIIGSIIISAFGKQSTTFNILKHKYHRSTAIYFANKMLYKIKIFYEVESEIKFESNCNVCSYLNKCVKL